jgi:hypothetical protein
MVWVLFTPFATHKMHVPSSLPPHWSFGIVDLDTMVTTPWSVFIITGKFQPINLHPRYVMLVN